ncbi:MAG: N-6 DNA methylase [Pseudanabaenaceae cyanobacterium SKYGB_i_bin29]|nr:N-6 DNA methylase [Pseudanabaenaceae cyanobacterium SKYG29]MDW8420810.1 N-6 DNA methylase [Pseudanabaenaceae cyanobacterium SKYGB_i_bin29]
MNNSPIKIEGNLISLELNDLSTAISQKGDEIALTWSIAKAQWQKFQYYRQHAKEDDTGTSMTREQWAIPLLTNLGFNLSYQRQPEVIDNLSFPISHLSMSAPIHIVSYRVGLEQRQHKFSPHTLLQEYLNRKEEYLWGIVTNGLQWRLLRDSSLMTRLTYIEFDLESILDNENYRDFQYFYLLCHSSVFPSDVSNPHQCKLEEYHQKSIQEGQRVRDRLRDGVEKAIVCLANGFLQYPRNTHLQSMDARQLYRLLLLLIYRLLFLMTAESRNILQLQDVPDGQRDSRAEELRQIYQEFYSIERLRCLADRYISPREGYTDLWQKLCVTFALFNEQAHGSMLGLSPLNGGLFNSQVLQDLETARIDNHDLLTAIRYLSLYDHNNRKQRVNYAAIDVEELGSVYESLLDFAPVIVSFDEAPESEVGGKKEFRFIHGTERKSTGSYYTPSALVAQVIKHTLEPIVQSILASEESGIDLGNSRGLRAEISQRVSTLSESSSGMTEGVGNTPDSSNGSGTSPITSDRSPSQTERNSREDATRTHQSNTSEIRPASLKDTPHSHKIQKLLSLKICDPACGSGHFLLAAARYLGKEIAKLETGEDEPNPLILRRATRSVIQHCIYGVDINPLAVDLCKVALWIEGFCGGVPLNFLDHRIKCGNSLVGVFDLEVLKEGIPDSAYEAVTGDDKSVVKSIKKDNKNERTGQLSLLETWDYTEDRSEFAREWQELGEIPEETAEAVQHKQKYYQTIRNSDKWCKDRAACNLWTAAFFTPLTSENRHLVPTTKSIARVLGSINSHDNPHSPITQNADRLAEELKFFHWALEFPEVFEQGGFDCVIGNPPWERIKLQEKEFFASRDIEIAEAQNKAEREKLIKTLPERKPQLAKEWENAKRIAENQSIFIRGSERFPLTSRGDINTYAVFSELARNLINPHGRAGLIVPTGIATDDTCKFFFGNLIQHSHLVCLFDFENREIFPAVHRSYKFSILVTSKSISLGCFAFFLTQPQQIEAPNRTFTLSAKDIALMNPNTLTCPVFRTKQDAELTKKIYQRVPVLENERTGENPWGISFMTMFHMSNDSHLFFGRKENDSLLPLYEAKLFHQYDHRWATYINNTDTRDLTEAEKQDPNYTITPRYWVSRTEVENRLAGKWNKQWLIGYRRISNTTNERTFISCMLPKAGFGDNVFLILPSIDNNILVSCFYGCLNSLPLDFIARQKMGGTNLNFFIVKQLPVLPPTAYTSTDIECIVPRVFELVYTAYDLKPFADDLWRSVQSEPKLVQALLQQWSMNHATTIELSPSEQEFPLPPFRWDTERRALLRAELDAYYAYLYGLTRDELRYILDPADVYGADFPSETFRVLKEKEIKQYGEYRTRCLVLEAWDRMNLSKHQSVIAN